MFKCFIPSPLFILRVSAFATILPVAAHAQNWCNTGVIILKQAEEAAVAAGENDLTRSLMTFGTVETYVNQELVAPDDRPEDLNRIYERMSDAISTSQVGTTSSGEIMAMVSELAAFGAASCDNPEFSAVAPENATTTDPALAAVCTELTSRLTGFEEMKAAINDNSSQAVVEMGLTRMQGSLRPLDAEMQASRWTPEAVAAHHALFEGSKEVWGARGADLEAVIGELEAPASLLSAELEQNCG